MKLRIKRFEYTKFLTVFLTALLAVSLCFCGCDNAFIGNTNTDNASSNTANSSSQNSTQNEAGTTVGIAWRADTDSEFYTNVVEAVKAAGGNPILLNQVTTSDLPYDGNNLSASYVDAQGYVTADGANVLKNKNYDHTNIAQAMQGIDRVIFTGGEDVSPALVIESIYPKYLTNDREFNATRDVSDYLLMNYCLDNNIKVMGICRGMQMLGICSNAPILQDIPTYYQYYNYQFSYEHRNKDLNEEGYRDYASHDVDIVDDHNILYECFQTQQLENVPSWHHQAILSVEGTHLRKIAKTTTGGYDITEAVERWDKDFALGIQFHPEAAYVKHANDIENADNYMDTDTSLKVFKKFCEN